MPSQPNAVSYIRRNSQTLQDDIQRADYTLSWLSSLMEDLARPVELHQQPAAPNSESTAAVRDGPKLENPQLEQQASRARQGRILMWWFLAVASAVLAIVAAVLVSYFGMSSLVSHSKACLTGLALSHAAGHHHRHQL